MVALGTDEVYNPITGKIWMDRNLGASQVATKSDDPLAYGDLYQWGRATEGHEDRLSETTIVLATTAVPNGTNEWDTKFILQPNSPFDWLSSQDDNLWQGESGTNNPCPTGFRLPTSQEWTAELASWSTQNTAGAFASALKLPAGRARQFASGDFIIPGSSGAYWSVHLMKLVPSFFYSTSLKQ